MMLTIAELRPTRAAVKKFFVNNKYTIGFTKHAIDRCRDRGLDCVKIIESLSGVPLRLWKCKGVTAKKNGNYIKVITCWRVKEVNIKPLW